ncbi:hypothetical protein BKA82DRAFT_10855 [Pisolithus tinctorius]|uniref:Uncharacterized protein n=1 Tax=Pisolithus tinctorius Marx 270 TaxID=870435 RepID=A0A0C3N746_PISTI|nr:hypothetical protein BKA82DRAFT_10855 [Pisolithus tinctorius]KIN96864.1 hypothetical protein M404DRAFT_10855 [Pisolithus tinctorius Marx 270]
MSSDRLPLEPTGSVEGSSSGPFHMGVSDEVQPGTCNNDSTAITNPAQTVEAWAGISSGDTADQAQPSLVKEVKDSPPPWPCMDFCHMAGTIEGEVSFDDIVAESEAESSEEEGLGDGGDNEENNGNNEGGDECDY